MSYWFAYFSGTLSTVINIQIALISYLSVHLFLLLSFSPSPTLGLCAKPVIGIYFFSKVIKDITNNYNN